MAVRPAGALMAKAAFAVAVEAAHLMGFTYGARVVLLVGAGDNGGDALFAGAELARRGVAVTAVLAFADRAHPAGLIAFLDAGGRVLPIPQVGDVDVIIDGLVGIGAAGPLRDALVALTRFANESAAPVLSVDIPSGVSPDTGEVAGEAIRADVTVCMGGLKPGLLVGAGREHAGRVSVIDIGLGPFLPDPGIVELGDRDVAQALRRPGPADDKYTRGVVGIAAGSTAYPGAAMLTVASARAGGVGAVRYAGPAHQIVVGRFPDVIVCDSIEDAGRVQCWVVGPGLGTAGDAVATLEAALAADVPVLVDADGINLLAGRKKLLTGRSAPTVLTPHDREFDRLFGEVGPDRMSAARRAAGETGSVLLLKGFASLIAEPDGRCFVNPTGHPSLATAGSGDVLSGMIGSLLASGLPTSLAAATGAYLHGVAAAQAAATGPVTAVDLAGQLARTIAGFSDS